MSNHANIVVMHLTFVSERIPLVLPCPTFVIVPSGLGFSAFGHCGLLKETSCHSIKPTSVWRLPPSSFYKSEKSCRDAPHNRY